jgi:hypothetical protein
VSREHHFVVVLNEDTGQWYHDLDTESTVLPDGNLYDTKSGEWEIADDSTYDWGSAELQAMLDRQNAKEGPR